MRLWQWIVAVLAWLFGRRRRAGDGDGDGDGDGERDTDRIVPEGTPERHAENVVLALLALAVLWGAGFIVTYAEWAPMKLPNELLGICLAMCLASIGAALVVVATRLVVTEELEDDYPEEHPREQEEIVEIVHESGSRMTRKRLLIAAGAAAGGTLGLAALTPTLSLGPVLDTGPLDRTPWRPGVRLLDEDGKPILASDIEYATFYYAFAEGVDPEDISSELIVLRLDPSKLRLPADRAGWAPQGILAFSKVCTHAGCAIDLYRNPKFPPLEPKPALVCPCHYSTFDPYTGGTVIYGPAGRPLPQLPLLIDAAGYLRAAGNFSGRIGPAWWNVRARPNNE